MSFLLATTLALTARPMPLTLAPISETLIYGQGTSGDLQSWAADDNDARTVCRFFVTDDFYLMGMIQLRFDSGSAELPSGIEFRVKVPRHTPGRQTITVSFRKPDNLYDRSTVIESPIVDGTTYVALPPGPPQRYMIGNGQFEVRVETHMRGPAVASARPCTSFEFGNLVVTY